MLLNLLSVALSLIFVIATIIIGFYFYVTRNFNFWQKLGIPYVKPTPFVGNLKECVLQKTTIAEQLQRIYNEHSDKPYVGIFSFDKPSLLIRDLELVKNILVRDFQNFIDHVFTADEKIDPVFGNNLGVLKGQIWRHVRTKLNPAFTPRRMKMMFCLVDTCGKELVDCLDKITAKGSTVEVKELMARFTTDVIASCVFGIQSNSLKDPDAEFMRNIRTVFAFSVMKGLAMLTSFFAPFIKSFFRLKFMDNKTNNYLRQVVWSKVEYREKHGLVGNDLLDCVMELRKSGKNEVQEDTHSENMANKLPSFKIDGDLFIGQVFGFLFGGRESTASALAFGLYELAFYPEIQKSLREEILQVLSKHDGKVTYDGIQDMPYLDRVLSEIQRKYPVIPFVDRMTCSDYELPAPTGTGTVTLPAGTAVYIPVLAYHNDPTYYPEPEKFDPDRFTEEKKQSRPNYTYLPFGEGPRICIGMRFAIMLMKTGLCHILSRFEVAPCKETPVPIGLDTKSVLVMTDGDVPLSFKRIQY